MTEFATDTARRVMKALNRATLNSDTDLHYDVWLLAQEILTPSLDVEAPEVTDTGLYRWTGPSGWKVTVNRFGDLYVSDSRIPAAERAVLVDIIRAAHALGRHLPAPDLDQPEAS